METNTKILIAQFICSLVLVFNLGYQMRGWVGETVDTNVPTAMDVYQGKTSLEYNIVDGVKTDSVVVYKK